MQKESPAENQSAVWRTLIVVGGGILLDQVTKLLALGLLSDQAFVVGPIGVELAFNPGFLGGSTQWGDAGSARAHVIGLGISFALTGILVGWELRKVSRGGHIGILMIVAGVLGNLIDRLVRWEVVDFLRAGSIILNVADLLQWVGVALLIYFGAQVFRRVMSGTERRLASPKSLAPGKRARRLAWVGMLACLLGPQVAGAIFTLQQAPHTFMAWATLAMAFDLPAFYLIYRFSTRIGGLANGPIFATIRFLDRVGTETETPILGFRDGEEVPELAAAARSALERR